MCGGGGGGGGGGESEADRMDREDRELGQSQRAGTFEFANSTLGTFLGDNRSDQQIENDQRQTEAIERGDKTFERVEGGRASTAGYRDLVAPQAGSLLANLNSPPTVGGFAGFGTSSLIGGPLGFVAGQAVRMGVNSLLGDRSVLGGR